jgi:chromosome segregation ATPase
MTTKIQSTEDSSVVQTDTPRTDAYNNTLGVVPADFACQLERELNASQSEVERLQTLPESRHQAFLDLLARAEKAEAEVAKLNHQLLKTESDLLQSQDINSFLDAEFRIACKRAERAEAEVERLLERAENAEADLIRTQIEMQLEIDKAEAKVERLKKELADWAYGTRAKREQEARKKAEAEVESLREKLDTAIEIAKDALWYARIYENEIHFNKMDGLYQKLVALKNK